VAEDLSADPLPSRVPSKPTIMGLLGLVPLSSPGRFVLRFFHAQALGLDGLRFEK
jgi:hypothetical protein